MNRVTFASRALVIGTALIVTSLAHAASVDQRPYGFIEGFAVQDEERIPQRKVGYGARFGLGAPISDDGRTALEGSVFANRIMRKAGSNGQQDGIVVDLVYTLPLGIVDPFAFAGLGFEEENLGPVDASSLAIEAGLGAKFALGDRFKLRTSVSAQDLRNSSYPGLSSLVDYRFNVGLQMPFGEVQRAPAPAPRVVDTDGDGLPDAQDRCPSEAAATADGCPAPVVPVAPPKDSDNDGVDDSQDACPGTLEGMKVDARGCASEAAQSVVLKGVTFLSGSAELTTDAKGVLDKAAEGLAGQPGLKVEIGGHTDSMGDKAKNLALSQRRADSVRKYLVGKGIDAGRLTAKGYGSTQPIADNKTKSGRAENRRVELKVVQ